MVHHLVSEGDGDYPSWYSDLVWSQTQSVSGFCVPVSVAMVVSQFFGNEDDIHSEMELVSVAISKGWMHQNADGTWTGLDANQAALLLKHYNIPSHVEQGTIADLRRYIGEGRGVILAVDSSEVWTTADDDATDQHKGADHALVIKAIDDNSVTLFDPGDAMCPVRVMSLADFEDAWEDSGDTMVVTDATPQRHASDPAVAHTPHPSPAPAQPAHSVLSTVSTSFAIRAAGLVLLPLLLRAKSRKR
jgi:hypothetical protein